MRQYESERSCIVTNEMRSPSFLFRLRCGAVGARHKYGKDIRTAEGISREDHLPEARPCTKNGKVGNGCGREQIEEDYGENGIA